MGSWTDRYLLYMAAAGEMGYGERISGNFAKIEEVLGVNEDTLDTHRQSHDTVNGILTADTANIKTISGAVFPTTISTKSAAAGGVIVLAVESHYGSGYLTDFYVPVGWAFRGNMRAVDTTGGRVTTLYGIDLYTGEWTSIVASTSMDMHHYIAYASRPANSQVGGVSFYMVEPFNRLTSIGQ
ncbi:hypothetical protein O0S10_01785 [Methanocorpusculum sp. MG]|uniref:Tail fiber protein n=1 Tax=Methanocorpusculum petauri TaxID=3002863 RepID=A0ABT4IDZ1_9EURY|nr:hypothetical protein [Methanocorpusculum petauri]MCZ0859958.1 hypothetical protein [Methanocorpusculum petauri]